MFLSIGSCRVNNPLLSCKLKNLDYHIPEFYTHSTKEAIQMIEFLQKKIISHYMIVILKINYVYRMMMF